MSKVMTHRTDKNPPDAALGWLPRDVRLYLDHVVHGQSLRALARREGCNASTVLRLVRRYEARRDDPLLDQALTALALGASFAPLAEPKSMRPTKSLTVEKDPAAMTASFRPSAVQPIDEATLQREARRVLRRLVEPGAFLAIAPDLDKAAVMRSTGGAEPVTTTSLSIYNINPEVVQIVRRAAAEKSKVEHEERMAKMAQFQAKIVKSAWRF